MRCCKAHFRPCDGRNAQPQGTASLSRRARPRAGRTPRSVVCGRLADGDSVKLAHLPRGTRAAVAALALGAVLAPTASAASPAARPGPGMPAITIGAKTSPERDIVAALYAQALRAKGYKVALKHDVGGAATAWKRLKAGRLDLYPERVGTLLTTIAPRTTRSKSAKDAYRRAKAAAARERVTLLAATPFADAGALATTTAYAEKSKLDSIADLAKLGAGVKLGAPADFARRAQGLPGIRAAYGLNLALTPVARGLAYTALDSGRVDVQSVRAGDGQLASGRYALLRDPKGVFGYQNVAPVVRTTVLTTRGAAFATTLDAVSRLLTTKVVQSLNAAVAIDKGSLGSVAKAFLKANDLL